MLEKTQSYFFFGLLALVILVAFVIAFPYLPALVFACALAVIFRPLYERVLKRVRGKEALAAWLTILIVIAIVLVPLMSVGFQVFNEARTFYGHLAQNGLEGFRAGGALQEAVGRVAPSLSDNSKELGQKILSWMVGSAGLFFGHAVTVLLNIFICFIAFFYFLTDGKRIRDWLVMFSPLPENYDNMILDRLSRTVASVIRGTLVIASLQGMLTGIGFWLFGIPNPALWGSTAAISALIPGVGTSLVLIPAVLYAFIFGNPLHALGLLAWSLIAVGLIDNFLGPRLIHRGAKIHPFAIFISVMGGLAVFGPLGFVIGPLVFSLLFTLFDIYGSIHEIERKQGE